MTFKYTSLRKFFLYALMLHGLVLLAVSLKLLHTPILTPMVMNALPVSMVSVSATQPQVAKPEKKILAKEGLKKAVTHTEALPKVSAVTHKAIEAPGKKILNDPLLKLLHEVIASYQTYPDEASMLNQSGTVRVGLMVFPDGHIEKIALLQSSGVQSLDSAAIDAVHSIASVKDANLYIKTPQYFSVDVVFQL